MPHTGHRLRWPRRRSWWCPPRSLRHRCFAHALHELALTGAGRRLLARCPEPTQARLVASLKRMSPDELASLKAGIAALEREMGTSGAARMFFDEEAPSGRSTRAARAAVRP